MTLTPKQHNTITAALLNEQGRRWQDYHRAKSEVVRENILARIEDLRDASQALTRKE